jgi:hypothetical protein
MTNESEFDPALDAPIRDDAQDRFDDETVELDRGDTGVRILFTLLFFVIARLVEGLLFLLVLFELGVALITQREPGPEIKRFANQIISYLVRIGRYISYNDERAPFPFNEFPAELDLTRPAQDPN